jgi:HK97 family phage major capsid protein
MERNSTQTRTLVFDLEHRASDDAIPVVVSTDSVVDMPDGPEILQHTPDAVDLSRAPLPIIATHRSGQVNIGVIDNLSVSRGQLRGLARFGTRTEAAEYKQDVLNRVIRSVSVGYARIKGKVRADGVLVTTRWMPSHTALVAEPADINAGFFRSMDAAPRFELETEQQGSPPAAPAASSGVSAMSEQQAAAGAIADVKVIENGPPVDYEIKRKQAVRNLCKASKIDARLEAQWLQNGTSIDEVAEGIMAIVAERSKDETTSVAHLDLSAPELKQYSLFRALRASMNKDWTKAGFELECNREISKRMNRLPRSETAFFVPLDKLLQPQQFGRQQRDMTVAGVSGSNYLVGTENQPGSFIELLRNTSVALRMGVTRLPGLVGNVTIPKMTAGNTAYWLADESTQITESQPTIGQLSLAPKNVAALTELSHQLLQQSAPAAEQLVYSSIARDIGLAVDVGILRGSGSAGQPTGIATTGSIGAFTGTSLASPGVLDAQADVAAANALNPGCGYVTTPAVAALLMQRPELPTTGTERLWKGNLAEGRIFDFPAMSSAQMSSATMLFGWWPSVILAEWGVLELMSNPFSDFTRGLTAVRGWYTCDVGVRYAGAWSYSSSIT